MFNARFAHRLARRYRKRGLDRSSRRIVGFLEQRGITGASVLEIGGGVGEIQVELLKRGAASSMNLELSPAYDADAVELAQRLGLAERVERRMVDIAVEPASVRPADIVVLHRVVCCYPDYEPLLAAAADHARRLLVFSYPRYGPVTRAAAACQNVGLRVSKRQFRVFAHPPAGMLAVLSRHGLHSRYAHHGIVWQIAGFER